MAVISVLDLVGVGLSIGGRPTLYDLNLHEAAIGSVDKKQVETLMARGLTEEESVDVVVRAILR
jgi:SUF system FeS cluster assembly, SufBD